ncbi:MAG: glycoside hydrolase family 2 protein [Solirubrobacterales bacterium]
MVARAAFLLLVSATFSFALLPGNASADAPTLGAPYIDGPSARFTVGGKWFLKQDPSNVGLRQRYAKTKDFGSWTPISVPNAFNAGDASESSYTGGVAWYATEITRPATPHGGRWIFHFDSVNYKATVFINGKQIGTHSGGYVPFEVNAGAMHGGVNRLVVRVDSRLSESSVPSQEVRNDQLTGGWWNYGGILRNVIMRRVGALDIPTVTTRSSFKSTRGPAKITVLATLRNFSSRKKVRIKLSGHFGRAAIKFRPVVMRRGSRGEIAGTAVMRKPKLWGPLSPNLYTVRISGPGIRYTQRAGIRKFVVSKSGSLSLNGKKAQFRGISFHEADDKVGGAWTPAVRQDNLALISKLGANMIRTHYPLDPEIMQWADENGIMVWCQAPVFRPRETQLKAARYRRNAVAFTREMVIANRSHPSVLVWSLMNEAVPSGTTYLNKAISAQKAAVHKLDPAGLVGADYAGAPEDELQHPAYRKLDVLGINEYFGWYPGLLGSTLNMADLRPYLDYLHKAYSHQALFVTEFGAEANRSGSADELGTYEFQANFMIAQMRILRATPYLNGFFAWALKDYWVRPGWNGGNPDPSPPYSTKGLFDTNGAAKPAAAEVEREFKATPPFK